MRSRARTLVLAVAAVLAVSGLASAAASAAPVWKFNGTELSGNETIVGAALSSSLTIPGATTTCAHFLYNMKIKNSAGGQGEIAELPLYECTAGSNCTVKSIEPEKLPWKDHLTTIAGNDYLFIEGIQVTITYSGELCAIAGKTRVTGTAAGLIENSVERATFNKETFTAAGAALKVGSSTVEWNGVFPTEAFETHREQHLEG